MVPGATVTVINRETGLKRSAKTDDAGRFNFPQLKPGTYTVRVEAQGFEPQQADNVVSGLGQKQTVNLTLRVAQSKQTVEVTAEAAIINTSNANTSTTLNAPALENLPNPGGDMTYPLQFAPGALINTAGSGNDFVGGTNGYGNVEFNGLPALSNGYIVDGLETNDPLTNLNSGLSTNLVLGLNSISEVTVNTLSYSVDQGRYGASQVNYITKSGTNQFHGNLYELWNGAVLNAADYFTNATSGNHKPGSTVNHFGGSLGGPIIHDKLFFFFDSEWVRIASAYLYDRDRSQRRVPAVRFAATSSRWHRLRYRIALCACAANGAVLSKDVFAVREHQRNAAGRARVSFQFGRQSSFGQPSERERLRESERRFALQRRSRTGADGPHRLQHRPQRHHVVSFSGGHRTASCLHGSDQPTIQCHFPAAAVLFRGWIHARVLAEPGELLQSGVLVV